MSTPPIPGRVFDPAVVPDGSHTLVDLTTGELIHRPPSKTRADRLKRRQALHKAEQDRQAEQDRTAAHRGAEACRAALPARPTPIGLRRDHRRPFADLSNDLPKVGEQ